MKKCTSCGKLNDDEMRFCEECGTLLVEEMETRRRKSHTSEIREETINFVDLICELIANLVGFVINLFGGNRERINVSGFKNKERTFVPDRLKLCEGEKLIKQYYCAKERLAIFGINLHHFIQVTNKRIVYCKIGNSFFGPKEVQTEVPIDDVANISIERGYKLNLLSLLFGGLQFYPYFLVMLPATLVGLFLYKLDGIGIIATMTSVALFILSFSKKEVIINRKKYDISDALYYASLGLIFFAITGDIGNKMMSGLFGYSSDVTTVSNLFTSFEINTNFYNAIKNIISIVFYILIIKGSIDFLRCIVKKYYDVKVGAKSGQSYPINSGGTEIFALNGDIIEMFIPVVPVGNARVMESELNAMILDIQQLGDYGIEKWQEK